MSFLEQLKSKRENAIDSKVLEFAEEMESVIIQSAENGFSSYKYIIHEKHEDKHIMCSEVFAKKVEELMDGVKVEYHKVQKQNVLFPSLNYYEYFIRFSWGK